MLFLSVPSDKCFFTDCSSSTRFLLNDLNFISVISFLLLNDICVPTERSIGRYCPLSWCGTQLSSMSLLFPSALHLGYFHLARYLVCPVSKQFISVWNFPVHVIHELLRFSKALLAPSILSSVLAPVWKDVIIRWKSELMTLRLVQSLVGVFCINYDSFLWRNPSLFFIEIINLVRFVVAPSKFNLHYKKEVRLVHSSWMSPCQLSCQRQQGGADI